MNPQDSVFIPLIVFLVLAVIVGLIVFELLRLVRTKIQTDNAIRKQLQEQIDAGNLVVSHRYDPAGDALKYSASLYVIIATLGMLFTCCVLPLLSLLITFITGKTLLDLIPK